MGNMANSADPGEMPLNAAIHQGLHCLLRQSQEEVKDQESIESSTTFDSRHHIGII